MFEITGCQWCSLHKTARLQSRCLKGEGEVGARLVIYVDAPNFMDDRRSKPFVSEPADLLKYMLRRMSVPLSKVYLDYTVKCYPGKKVPSKKTERMMCVQQCNRYRIATLQLLFPREVVTFGGLSLEAFTGFPANSLKEHANAYWPPSDPRVACIVNRIWTGYSIGYPLQSPNEAHSQFGLLWMAAENAGLNPQIDPTVKPYTKFPLK